MMQDIKFTDNGLYHLTGLIIGNEYFSYAVNKQTLKESLERYKGPNYVPFGNKDQFNWSRNYAVDKIPKTVMPYFKLLKEHYLNNFYKPIYESIK